MDNLSQDTNEGPTIVYYGTKDHYINVTRIVTHFLGCEDKLAVIPAGDVSRSRLFGDPCYGVVKEIKVVEASGVVSYFFSEEAVFITLNDAKQIVHFTCNDPDGILHSMYQTIKLNRNYTKDGYSNPVSMKDEYSEQLMATMFIQPSDTVLELGSNIGRTTMIIANLIDDQQRLVTLEPDAVPFERLENNRTLNNLNFRAMNAALSYQPLMQKNSRSEPIPDDHVIPDDFYQLNTITLAKLQENYGVVFDCLVLDCEGAIHAIVTEHPDILTHIRKIIIKNDYTKIGQKTTVDAIFKSYGLKCVYSAPHTGLYHTYGEIFYEVWKR